MSVRTELEELIQWISDLLAQDKPQPILQSLPPERWRAVKRNLDEASDRFNDAAASLEALALSKRQAAVLAEFARDLQREAQGLALRAHLLSRRATRKTDTEVESPPLQLDAGATAGATGPPSGSVGGESQSGTTPPKVEAPAKVKEPESGTATGKEPGGQSQSGAELLTDDAQSCAAQSARSAANTVETARKKLEAVEYPDTATRAFEEDLDVLAEMTLSLRQQCERLKLSNNEAKPASHNTSRAA